MIAAEIALRDVDFGSHGSKHTYMLSTFFLSMIAGGWTAKFEETVPEECR